MSVINHFPKQVVLGVHSIQELSKILIDLKIERVFIIYSASAMKDYLQSLQKQLPKAVFYEISKGEPTIDEMQRVTNYLQDRQCDGVVAIGGGSVIDLAKAVAVKAINPHLEINDIPNLDELHRLPLIAIPTTAGTGSEATKITVLTDTHLHKKLNPSHPSLIPDVVILDANLTRNVPASITVYTALDALTHAIEAFVSTKANPISDYFAKEAIRLIANNIQAVYDNPHNIEIREHLLLGSFYAGIAFSNASTNLAHATGRAIGAKFLLPHGLCVALMHPFVIEFTMESCLDRYEEIAKVIGLSSAQHISYFLFYLNEQLGVWEAGGMIVESLTEGVIEELTEQALSGNGILTNRKIPTRGDINVLFHNLSKRLQVEGSENRWH
jgi:alcohol dehydrogenase class IV